MTYLEIHNYGGQATIGNFCGKSSSCKHFKISAFQKKSLQVLRKARIYCVACTIYTLSFVLSRLQKIYIFFNWDSFHARVNSNYKARSYKKKKHKKIKAHRKSVYKEHTVKRCLLILDLKLFRS